MANLVIVGVNFKYLSNQEGRTHINAHNLILNS